MTITGKHATKLFDPQYPSYLRVIPSDVVLQRVLAPIMAVLSRHAANVGAVFLADEPYLHGISKSELERTAKFVRRDLDRHGLTKVKIGVIFASGMFDPTFAHLIEREAGAYVERIDRYYASHGEGAPTKLFAEWVSTIKRSRLVTYDEAGNMYVHGGLPRERLIYSLLGCDVPSCSRSAESVKWMDHSGVGFDLSVSARL